MQKRSISSELATAMARVEQGDISSALAALHSAVEAWAEQNNGKPVPTDDAMRDAELLRIQQRMSEGHLHEAALLSSIALLHFPEVPILRQLDAQILERIRVDAEQAAARLEPPPEKKPQTPHPPAPPETPDAAAPPAVHPEVKTPDSRDAAVPEPAGPPEPSKAPQQPPAQARAASDERAERALTQILALDSVGTVPALKKALELAGESLRQSGDHPLLVKARNRLEKRVKDRDAELQGLISKVRNLVKKERFDDAKAGLEQALALDPESEELHRFKADMSKARRKSVWERLAAEKSAAQVKPNPEEPLGAGQVLAGRYEIQELLGMGGMSAVYKARDVLAGHPIAIKVVLPRFSKDDRLREKFKKELLVARRLTHPNVVRIHDIGEHQGLLFISMELVDGRTLAKVLADEKRLGIEEFLGIFNQLAPALGYIHSQKILHRDIKPQNLMVDAGGTLKVMDFGIARDLVSDKTTAAIPMGTPSYMSPELFNGEALSPASDIYSAGVVFYEMLTGMKPFGNTSLHERLNKPVPRVSGILPDFPRDLDDAVHRCMEIQPENRFQSVEAMIAAFSTPLQPAGATPGRLTMLLLEQPAPLQEALLAFIRVVERISAIHAAGDARPVLTPHAIRWTGTEADLDVAQSGRQQTQAVHCKYASAEEFQEAPMSGPRAIASDTYVVGFIFYEIFLGQRRFREQFAECYDSDAELKWLNWHSDPARSAPPLKELLRNIPPELSHVIERMTIKDAEGRPALEEVLAALKPLRTSLLRESGKTVVLSGGAPAAPAAPAPANAKETAKPARKKGFPEWAFGLIALLLLAAAVFFVWKAM